MASYYQARDAAEAVALHSSADGSAYLAGGQTLLAALNRREQACTRLIDVRRIPALRRIGCETGGGLSIGAAVTLSELLHNRAVLSAMPVLADALAHVGNHTVRNCSTLGGHIALADGWSEVNLVLMAAGAVVTTDLRRVPVSDVIVGHRSSALLGGELIQSVLISPDALRDRYGFHEFTLRASGGRAIAAAVVRVGAMNVTSAVLSGVTANQIVLHADAVRNAPEFLDHALSHSGVDVQPAARWPRDYRHRLGVEALRRALRRASPRNVE
jgi:carbon-monoxide dehydrogenase medium subunit